MTRREVMIHIHAEHSGLTLGGMPLFLDGAANGSDGFEELEDAENEQHFRELLSTTEAEPEISEMLVEGRLITTTRRARNRMLSNFATLRVRRLISRYLACAAMAIGF